MSSRAWRPARRLSAHERLPFLYRGVSGMDYRVYHAINDFVVHHASWLGRLASHVEAVGVPAIAVATVALWLLARPGAGRKWKLAASTALASAGIALLGNQVIAAIWHRPRPYEAHPELSHPWAHSHDPSFPSDHASAAFAIAFAVLLYDRLAGALFLVAAVVIGGGRVVIGAHYPGDVLAGVLVGLACALLLGRLARPLLELLVRLVERITDPLLGPLWRLARH